MRDTDEFDRAKHCYFLAVRGKLSRKQIMSWGAHVPEVYGDPAILLPLMYNPDIKATHKVGIIPHFVDEPFLTGEMINNLVGDRTWKKIDVCQDYQSFVNEVLTCEYIISSSLHGLIIAEAYGIPVQWITISDKVIGKGFKFRDYLSATDRVAMPDGKFPMMRAEQLKKLQDGLIHQIAKI